MSKEQKKKKSVSKKGYTFVKSYKEISEYRLDNGLSVLYKHMEGTGVVTTNLTYRVGSRNEVVGETGLAHMLEHMLFKPTTHDLKRKVDSGAMQFERETGCILNATTWKDRTTYFFSYPKEYFARALQIEAERMHDVVLSDKEFIPERGNVLSEFDMYFGDPYFALNFEMVSSAFHSHPYGHETIGFREDIERYTVEKLDAFYKKHYDPHNATLVIVGDISKSEALNETVRFFGGLATRGEAAKPPLVIEPKQEEWKLCFKKHKNSATRVYKSHNCQGLPHFLLCYNYRHISIFRVIVCQNKRSKRIRRLLSRLQLVFSSEDSSYGYSMVQHQRQTLRRKRMLQLQRK